MMDAGYGTASGHQAGGYLGHWGQWSRKDDLDWQNCLALYRTGQKGDAGSRRYVPRRGGQSAGNWAKLAGADIVRHGEGADPAAVVYDSIAAAKARGCDLIIIARHRGRLHNKQNLMNELGKIDRIIYA